MNGAGARRGVAVDAYAMVAGSAQIHGSTLPCRYGDGAVRILFANHTGDWSGAEVALLRLINGLSDDHEIAVACPPSGRVAATLDAVGIRRFDLPATDVSLRPHAIRTPAGMARIARAGVALRTAAARHRSDVIHANSLRAGLTSAVAARLGSPPVVVQVHEHLPDSLLANATRLVVARTATAVVGVTAHTAANFNEGLANPVAEHIYISIDHERFDPDRVTAMDLRGRLGVPEGTKLIAQIAQITPWKGQETAIRMLARIRRKRSDVNLVLVGEIAFNRKSTRFVQRALI
jgi:glycosyltransferase involved in cell wall biosynthesis